MSFDEYARSRVDDLLIIDNKETTLISVEAKTDEHFGDNNFLYELHLAIEDKIKNSNSNRIERMLGLYKNYFNGNNTILDIMYQLTYWFAGSIAETTRRNCKNIILLNQVFYNSTHNEENICKNHKDFEDFAKLISKQKIIEIKNNILYGPITNEYTNGKNIYLMKQFIKIDD